jgi:cysteine desulfurase/selenocysteine lyase
MFDPKNIRKDFPILSRKVHGKPLAYLDNASTTQKPRAVIEALCDYYEKHNANIHRGIHTISEEAMALYEGTRQKTADFIGAKSTEEIVFTRNATEAINIVALSLAGRIGRDDNIVITALEHHSNFLPWLQMARKKGAELRVIPVTADGELDLKDLHKIIDKKTEIVAFTMMSNVLGTIVPFEKIIAAAKDKGALTVADGAQFVPHFTVDAQRGGFDFLAFSAHKMLGPTGVGVLYGRKKLLEQMEPVLFGGEMVKIASYGKTEWSDLPWKFEAGTPNIADVCAFGAAIDYLRRIGMKNIRDYTHSLYKYARKKIGSIKGVTVYGPKDVSKATGIVSFNVDGVHPHDTGTILDNDGIAIRAGHHCCQPLMARMGVTGTARIGLYVYNTKDEIDRAAEAGKKAVRIFKV